MKVLRTFVRWLTQWAWEPGFSRGQEAIEELFYAKSIAYLRTLQLSRLEELFREKQAKITRLQACYSERKRPMYEDMRSENMIRDTEALAQSISVLAQRSEAHRERTGKPMRHSDGTVVGVPGDQPNVEVGQGWGA